MAGMEVTAVMGTEGTATMEDMVGTADTVRRTLPIQ